MNKLWLSAITAACLLAGNAAQAGDHGHGHDDWDRGHREYRHCDDDRGWHRGWGDRGYYHRPVVYVRPVVYSRPVYYERAYEERPVYYERPAYYGSAYGGDGEIHGTVSVGF